MVAAGSVVEAVSTALHMVSVDRSVTAEHAAASAGMPDAVSVHADADVPCHAHVGHIQGIARRTGTSPLQSRQALAPPQIPHLGARGPLSQGVQEGRQALGVLHIHGMWVHRKRPRGFK